MDNLLAFAVLAATITAIWMHWRKQGAPSPPPAADVRLKSDSPVVGANERARPRHRHKEVGGKRTVYLPHPDGFFLEVAGESHYQPALRELFAGDEHADVRLTAEPTNPYDPNAVAVQTFGGDTLGYLTAHDAARYQQLILQIEASGAVPVCQAKAFGGTGLKPSIGIYLSVDPPTAVADALGLKYRRVSTR